MSRGVSALVGAVMMAAIAVSMAALVGGWLPGFSTQQAETVKNNTATQLECQFADIFIRNSTYNCYSDCSDGVLHNLTLSVVNSGKIKLYVDKVFVQNTTGHLYTMNINATYIDAGSTMTLVNQHNSSCNGINRTIEKIIITSPTCPSTAVDSMAGSLVNFANC